MQALPETSQRLCLLRAPELEDAQYHELVSGATRAADWNRGAQWMLHGSLHWLQEFPDVAGLQMPWREARRHRNRPIDDGYWLAVSCHNAEEIQHAARLQADFITLGPVKPTRSHPDAVSMGIGKFRELVADAPMVVYGLGGLEIGDEPEMKSSGAQGIAGISYWWPGSSPKR